MVKRRYTLEEEEELSRVPPGGNMLPLGEDEISATTAVIVYKSR
jgi:hypothetical protein